MYKLLKDERKRGLVRWKPFVCTKEPRLCPTQYARLRRRVTTQALRNTTSSWSRQRTRRAHSSFHARAIHDRARFSSLWRCEIISLNLRLLSVPSQVFSRPAFQKVSAQSARNTGGRRGREILTARHPSAFLALRRGSPNYGPRSHFIRQQAIFVNNEKILYSRYIRWFDGM